MAPKNQKRKRKSPAVKEYEYEFTLYLAGESVPVYRGFEWDRLPASVLVSYAYPNWIDKLLVEFKFAGRKLFLDSGAFTAYTQGKEISLDKYISWIQEGPHRDRRWDVVTALDVIGDPKASYENSKEMQRQGIDPLPVFHCGEDWSLLHKYCDEFEVVGLAATSGRTFKEKKWFISKCFQECWPHKFHSFGWASEDLLRQYPFYSADSSAYLTGGMRWGQWKSLGGMRENFKARKGGAYDAAKLEIAHALRIEKEIGLQWQNELRNL